MIAPSSSNYTEFDSSSLKGPANLSFGPGGVLSGTIPLLCSNQVRRFPPQAGAVQLLSGTTLSFAMGAATPVAPDAENPAETAIVYSYTTGGSLTISGPAIATETLVLGAGTLRRMPVAGDAQYFLLVEEGPARLGEFLMSLSVPSGGSPTLNYAALILND